MILAHPKPVNAASLINAKNKFERIAPRWTFKMNKDLGDRKNLPFAESTVLARPSSPPRAPSPSTLPPPAFLQREFKARARPDHRAPFISLAPSPSTFPPPKFLLEKSKVSDQHGQRAPFVSQAPSPSTLPHPVFFPMELGESPEPDCQSPTLSEYCYRPQRWLYTTAPSASELPLPFRSGFKSSSVVADDVTLIENKDECLVNGMFASEFPAFFFDKSTLSFEADRFYTDSFRPFSPLEASCTRSVTSELSDTSNSSHRAVYSPRSFLDLDSRPASPGCENDGKVELDARQIYDAVMKKHFPLQDVSPAGSYGSLVPSLLHDTDSHLSSEYSSSADSPKLEANELCELHQKDSCAECIAMKEHWQPNTWEFFVDYHRYMGRKKAEELEKAEREEALRKEGEPKEFKLHWNANENSEGLMDYLEKAFRINEPQ